MFSLCELSVVCILRSFNLHHCFRSRDYLLPLIVALTDTAASLIVQQHRKFHGNLLALMHKRISQ